MSGIESNEDILFPGEQKERKIRGLKIKFLICLLVSNCFIYLLSNLEKSEVKSSKKTPITAPQDHQIIQVPLRVFIPIENKKKVAVSLYSKSGYLLAREAYLYSDTKTKYDTFQVAVKESDLNKLITRRDEQLVAFPKLPKKKNLPKRLVKKEKSYEIIF